MEKHPLYLYDSHGFASENCIVFVILILVTSFNEVIQLFFLQVKLVDSLIVSLILVNLRVMVSHVVLYLGG